MLDKKTILDNLTINFDSKKCFVFDLDGTIVFNNTLLSISYQQILQSLIDRGHEVVFATGRSYRDFKTVMPAQFHESDMTLFSGSLSRGNNGNIYRSIHLPKICVEEVVDICLRHKAPFIMDNISHYYHPPFADFTFGFVDSQVSQYQIKNMAKILNTDIYKILILDMNLHDLFTEYATANNLAIKHHSYDRCFDLVVSGCNKYDGVLPFVAGFAHDDIFVFGNDFNDYEMLAHFPNSIVFGSIPELVNIAKLNIPYDSHQKDSFNCLINTILG